MTSDAIISLQRVSVTYRSGPAWNRRVVHAVRGVDIAIPRGTILGLVGESGSGKTTVGRLCLGLLRPTEGAVLFDHAPMPGYGPPTGSSTSTRTSSRAASASAS